MKYLLPLALVTLAACAEDTTQTSTSTSAVVALSPGVTSSQQNGALYIIGGVR